jgi:protein-tyrosine phosphatase
MSPQSGVTVLHVCMGNICRSPMAERLMRHRLDEAFGAAAAEVRCAGAGTYGGHAGEGMNPPAARVLAEQGVDPSGFAATALEPGLALAADLILTATADQVRPVGRLAPTASPRVFALLEFAALADQVGPVAAPTPGGAVVALAAAADEARAAMGLRLGADVPDPWGEPLDVFRATRDLIDDAVSRIVAALSLAG